MEKVSIDDLLGKVIVNIDYINYSECLDIITEDGCMYEMKHKQDCCEVVWLQDIAGDLKDLIDSPIVEAEMVTNSVDEVPDKDGFFNENYYDTQEWTFYKLGTKNGFVTLRWCGATNSSYSIGVDIFKIKE